MRSIPGMTVICPADGVESEAALKAAYEMDGPVYLRFCRLATSVVNDRPDYDFKVGKAYVLREGTDVTIVACGLMVEQALEAARQLEASGVSAEVINAPTVKPLDAETIVASARKTGWVVTAEEHSVIGGLGSAVCDVLSEQHPVPVRKVGVEDTFGESGPAVEVLKKYGLTAEHVAEAALSLVK